MDILEYGTEYKKPSIMCLGYFDAVHLGHVKIIEIAKAIAKEKNLLVQVFIFVGGKNNTPDVFSFEERLIKLKALGVDTVIYKILDNKFMSKSKMQFLEEIFSIYNLEALVVGEDYTFGKDREGNVDFLINYCDNLNKKVFVCEKVLSPLGDKVSTKDIKTALINGDLILANQLLGSNYFIRGEVVKGKKLGSKLGFPTANILLKNDKMLINKGVYLTCTVIDGKLYSCLTNVGNQPTVNGESEVIETYIHNFSGDLYGKTISVYFIERIRDIVKFNDTKELTNQLERDMEYLK